MKNIKIILLLIPFLSCNISNVVVRDSATLQIYAKYINAGSDKVVMYTINGRGPFKLKTPITQYCSFLELDTNLYGLYSGDQVIFFVVGGNRISGNVGRANCPQSLTPLTFYSYDVRPDLQSVSLAIDRGDYQ
jgi:hypothetical protein